VKRMIVGALYDKKIEFRLTRPRAEMAAAAGSEL